jgi:hypothetical protein
MSFTNYRNIEIATSLTHNNFELANYEIYEFWWPPTTF